VGLLKTATRAAVASSVHGRVQRRQQSRWAEQERRAEAAQRAAPPPPPTPPTDVSAGPKDTRGQLELLAQLGELRKAGVLTEDEFEKKKAEILKS
jgi:Short C-terminal domain